jgi:hypothetical protein
MVLDVITDKRKFIFLLILCFYIYVFVYYTLFSKNVFQSCEDASTGLWIAA